MKKLSAIGFLLALLVSISGGPVSAESRDSHYPAPTAISMGSTEAPGPVLQTLTPELLYQPVGELNHVYIYDTNDSRLSLAELRSNYRIPVMVARVQAASLKIPAGVLLPGNSYYWYLQSTHAVGSKSENSKTSPRLYFSTAKDAK